MHLNPISVLAFCRRQDSGIKAGNCSVEMQLKFFHFQVSISFYIFASRGGLAHRHSLLEFPQQPQWMTARHWRGLFLWADTADLNFKTWCKTVIKSQLQLVSMKSQLSVSGAVNEVFFCQGDDRGSREQKGKRQDTKGRRKGRMKVSKWERTQSGRNRGTKQHLDENSVAQPDVQTSSAVETRFLPLASQCSHELWTICLQAASN